jgi:hypothetical protein
MTCLPGPGKVTLHLHIIRYGVPLGLLMLLCSCSDSEHSTILDGKHAVAINDDWFRPPPFNDVEVAG